MLERVTKKIRREAVYKMFFAAGFDKTKPEQIFVVKKIPVLAKNQHLRFTQNLIQ